MSRRCVGVGRGRVGLAVAVLAAAALSGGGARGQSSEARSDQALWPQPGKVSLTYELGEGTSGCEAEPAFRKWVASRMEQRDPFLVAGRPTHALRVHLVREPPGIRGVVELRDASGALVMRREALERECADLVDRLVLIVTLSVFPAPVSPAAASPCGAAGAAGCAGSGIEQGPGAQSLPSTRALAADIASLRERVSALEVSVAGVQGAAEDAGGRAAEQPGRSTSGHRSRSFTLSAGPLLTAGLTSEVGPGFWLGAEAHSSPLSLGLELRGVLPSRVAVDPPGGALSGPVDFDLSQLAAALVPCAGVAPFSGCLLTALGVEIRHDAEQAPGRRTGTSPFLSLGARVAVDIPFGRSRLGARIFGDVLYTIPSASAEYTDSPLRWDRPALSLLAGTGLVLDLTGSP